MAIVIQQEMCGRQQKEYANKIVNMFFPMMKKL